MRRIGKIIIAALLMALLAGVSAMAEAADITAQCKYWVSEGKTEPLTDVNITTAWSPKGDTAEVRFTFAEDAAWLLIEWKDEPAGYVFTQLDGAQNEIAVSTEQDDFDQVAQMIRLQPETRSASLFLTQPGQEICKVRVYSQGRLPADVKNFDPPHEKCDLLVISTHQDDEWIFFGGIIPYYEQVRGKNVQVMYMADCGRLRKAEALNGLWKSGTVNYPVFLDLKDEHINSYDKSLAHWGGTQQVAELLVEQIRRYKPEVILTHDIDGEYGHNQHKITSRHMDIAIELAADPNIYPESAQKYGIWQVKKLYLHLADKDAIDFDWNIPYDELDGRTPLQMAELAYAEHKSQHKYYQVEDGGQYDNSKFGLVVSSVGPDALHVDLFENIDPYAAVTPQPAATPEPTPEPTAAALPAPEATAAPIAQEAEGSGAGWIVALIAAVAVAAAVAVFLLYNRDCRRRQQRIHEQRRREREKRRRMNRY